LEADVRTDVVDQSAAGSTGGEEALLAVENLAVDYGKRQVLHGVSLRVMPGEIVTMLGHNGAGKTTLLRSAFGLVPVRDGKISVRGRDVTKATTLARVRAGISFTPAEKPIFPDLTIRKNLELGAFTVSDEKVKTERLDRVHDLFPQLAERSRSVAGTLSGGQQRMLAISIALMSGAKLMLLDEPSLGIAPSLVQEIFQRIRELREVERLAVLLVEQDVRPALRVADRAYFLRSGEVIFEASAEDALARGEWWDLY
jgi:branched-chain amino acid transport system ATP-binding protein